MKKLSVLFLLIMIILPLGAKASVSGRFGAGPGCEVFFSDPMEIVPLMRVESDILCINLDKRNSLSIPLTFEHSFRNVSSSRNQIVNSNNFTIGIGYSYKIGERVSLGVSANGGFRLFEYSIYRMAVAVVHSVEMCFSWQISKHLLLKTPMVFSSASYGNTISTAVALNII